MKQIYSFENSSPPALNENTIRAEIEKRRLRCQTVIIAIASLLMQTAMILLSFGLKEVSPLFSAGCIIYVIVSATGGCVISLLFKGSASNKNYNKKRGF